MDINSHTSRQLEQASIYSDLNSLNDIRELGFSDKEAALKQASKEFEAFFLNIMMKSMRQATAIIGDDSPLSSPQEKMYIGMLDDQMAVELSQKGLLGISDLLMQQFSQSQAKKVNQNEHDKNASLLIDRIDVQPAQKHSNLIDIKSSIISDENNTSDKDSKELESFETLANSEVAKNSLNNSDLVEPEKKALFKDAIEFVKTLLPYAEKAAKSLNLDPKLLLAQAALETGWGKFIMHDELGKPGFNLFGIKAENSWQGEGINIDTLEVEQQQFKKIKATFRKYDGFSESFEDYIQFVQKNPRYESAVKNSHDPEEYINQLQSSGYATDPNYAKKVMRIFNNEIFQSVDSINLGNLKVSR